ncbi:hypothetical protein jhhlp_005955 [Lomentospora prolificans]|uniref:FCH domain-containing protein n=1 Tax=Lomentospora prolificans TaxID=41688 RepID=A0A2N3N4J6_9PEZI|nr:hypothetical protein jhhlp_005955 [Lomentospora prolificans]
MEETTRTEYPAMLAYLQPSQAVHVLNDRVKRVTKLNVEIADWLQERRKVEEQYIQGLRKLMQFKVPNAASELGVFQGPWDKVLRSVESTAHSHFLYASRIEKDVEVPLRAFGQKKEVHNIQTIGANLASMARELEDAQDKSEKLTKKGTKASTQKVDAAASRLSAASQQWESQAPFIFETLQVLDEQRINQLRDLLTQLLTHESDQAQRNQISAGEALQAILDIQTPKEVENFSKKITDGKVKQEKKSAPTTRRPSATGSTLTPPATATTRASHEDETPSEPDVSEPTQR